MKKIILGLTALILVFVIACSKTSESTAEPVKALKSEKCMTVAEAHALGVYDDSSQDTEEQLKVDDSPIFDLNSRGATMAISSILVDTFSLGETDHGFEMCGKYRGTPKVGYYDTYFALKGYGFGTSKGSSSLVITINAKNYTLSDFQPFSGTNNWTDTLLYVGLQDATPALSSALVNELKYGNLKFTLTKGTETVSKTIKAISDWADGNNTLPANYYHSKVFGQPLWNVANERHKMGKMSLRFMTSYTQNSQEGKDGYCRKINPAYVPQVGDMVYRGYSQSNWISVNTFPENFDTEYEPMKDAGVVMVVGNDVKGVRDVTIWEMNYKCTGSIQKKKYKYMFGLFIPKSGEFPFLGYAR